MSPDTVDSLVVSLVRWIEKHCPIDCPDFENDAVYNEFATIVYNALDPFITRDRNYN